MSKRLENKPSPIHTKLLKNKNTLFLHPLKDKRYMYSMCMTLYMYYNNHKCILIVVYNVNVHVRVHLIVLS